jgi:prolyl-tRNA synthetase
MRMSQLIGRRIKEKPKDAELISHVYLVRGGFVKQVSAGIFTLMPLAKRITTKIERIIRNEMDAIGGQECLMPVVLPKDLWMESGRYQSVGKELVRFKDRNSKDLILGMTHEEAVVHFVRTEVTSYRQFPVMTYQIQTKFRDEPRCRGGLIRVREFTMKDAYSWHTSQECLESYYAVVHKAYEDIFRKAGLSNCISVESDTGMMGGAKAHEFMAVCDAGEDTLVICSHCGYKANKEVAQAVLQHFPEAPQPLKDVHTPGCETIEAVAKAVGVPAHKTAKALFVRGGEGQPLVFAFIRGDLEVNEAKLRRAARISAIEMAGELEIRDLGAEPGFASPLDVDLSKVKLVVDNSILQSNNLVCGANRIDYHRTGFNFERDIAAHSKNFVVADIASVREGDGCPQCQKALTLKRGVEVGNIFQLGSKYTESMGHRYLDEQSKEQTPIMGCYGIGVGRLMASVIENKNDAYGPIWPITIAPYEVHLNALNYSTPEVCEAAESLYKKLALCGFEVLFDDSDAKAGSQFADADLIGIPFRVIVSPKTLEKGSAELKRRGQKDSELVALANLAEVLKTRIEAAYAELDVPAPRYSVS